MHKLLKKYCYTTTKFSPKKKKKKKKKESISESIIQPSVFRGHKNAPNPYSPNVTFLYPLKMSESLRFSDVLRGYRNVTLGDYGLKNIRKYILTTPVRENESDFLFLYLSLQKFTSTLVVLHNTKIPFASTFLKKTSYFDLLIKFPFLYQV